MYEQKIVLTRVDMMQQEIHYVSKYSNVMNMLITPLFALIFLLFYKKERYSYIEHLIASMFFISFIMLFNALLIVPWATKTAFSFGWIFFLLTDVIYRSFAYRQFMEKKGFAPLLKAVGVSLTALLVWMLLSWFLLQQYIMTGF